MHTLHISQLDMQAPDWQHCRQLRYQVFVLEQQVPEALEWDAADATAIHLLARIHGEAVACARLLPGGWVGRMAVLAKWRRQGIAQQLLAYTLDYFRAHGYPEVRLSAQLHAEPIYARAGFTRCSEPYWDANILHVEMRLKLV